MPTRQFDVSAAAAVASPGVPQPAPFLRCRPELLCTALHDEVPPTSHTPLVSFHPCSGRGKILQLRSVIRMLSPCPTRMIIVSAQVRPASLLDVLMHHARLLHRLRHMHDNLLTRGGTAPKTQGLGSCNWMPGASRRAGMRLEEFRFSLSSKHECLAWLTVGCGASLSFGALGAGGPSSMSCR